ncbi:hypothetical protein CALCODRAFT_520922 [Calocera cornea HHB12733]|uniref:F-box domain-containing protein n=1 Tax=Calocera cornea HHB12733 TaxID=1353952 RepID=A0A165D542_9BASI|nr:hypothetical protein CALCODRAFT_520922 [Calocera cornea HHB12733]
MSAHPGSSSGTGRAMDDPTTRYFQTVLASPLPPPAARLLPLPDDHPAPPAPPQLARTHRIFTSTRSPIGQLAPDVLQLIFDAAYDELSRVALSSTRPLTSNAACSYPTLALIHLPTRLSLVCRTWRSVVRQTPRLWAHIGYLEGGRFVGRAWRNAREAPTTLWINSMHRSVRTHFLPLLRMVAPQQNIGERFRQIHVQRLNSRKLIDLLKCPFESLCDVHVSVCEDFEPCIIMNILGYYVPNLRSLSITSSTLCAHTPLNDMTYERFRPRITATLRRLQSLHLVNVPCAIGMYVTLRLRAPNLTEVVLIPEHYNDEWFRQRFWVEDLSNVERVLLGGPVTFNTVYHFVTRLRLLHTLQLATSSEVPRSECNDMLRLLDVQLAETRYAPVLQHLSIGGLKITPRVLQGVIDSRFNAPMVRLNLVEHVAVQCEGGVPLERAIQWRGIGVRKWKTDYMNDSFGLGRSTPTEEEYSYLALPAA